MAHREILWAEKRNREERGGAKGSKRERRGRVCFHWPGAEVAEARHMARIRHELPHTYYDIHNSMYIVDGWMD